jgi:integrase
MNKLVYQRSNKNSKVFSSLFKKGIKTSFPTLQDLELVKGRMRLVSNKKGEFLRKVHYRCFLLCSEAGLRISEAVKFDLKAKTRKGLYQITKPKKQKSRLVYVPKKVVRELKKQN